MENKILYYSTNGKAQAVSFAQALLKGQADDKGLYMPQYIPTFTAEEIESFSEKEYYQIAFEVIKKFLGDEIPEKDLLAIVQDAYNFEIPLEHAAPRKFVMRLDQGPTASFKDFAARFMGRAINYFLKKENRKMLILTATSGDTGSAVANAFYGLDSIEVVILFPENEVSDRQRKQMTTLEKNIHTLALNGKFDDCQALVKQAFADDSLKDLQLSSANSINIGRLIPQSTYYFYAYSQLQNENEKIVFAVPSGNFGDLMGGILAMKMGLPVEKFVIATNANKTVPHFLQTGDYQKIVPSINSISSAMNVGHPSNMARIVALYGGVMDETGAILKQPDLEQLRKDFFAISITDEETKQEIRDAYQHFDLLLEPHGAVAWAGLQRYLMNVKDVDDLLCVSLETAHPAKFPSEVESILGLEPEIPQSLKGLDNAPENFIRMENEYQTFKNYLTTNF